MPLPCMIHLALCLNGVVHTGPQIYGYLRKAHYILHVRSLRFDWDTDVQDMEVML